MPKNISSPNIIKLRIILISLFSILLVWQVSGRLVNHIRARGITPEEFKRVIKETLPRELGLLREEFKKLTPERRRQAVDNAVKDLKDLSREEKEWVDNLLTAPEGNAIVETALKSYYFDFSYPEKLELSPLIGAVSDELERIANK